MQNMTLATGEIQSDHDAMLEYIDTMKVVYQRTINKHQKSAGMKPQDVAAARNHLRALETMEKMLREHHEMTKGRDYDGRSRTLSVQLSTIARLILPDGTVKEINRV